LSRTIAQAVYDGGEEEAECIDWHRQSVETETIEVDLWVLECLSDTIPGKPFVSSSVAVILEPCEDVFPFLRSEKLGRCGVIINEKVSGNGEGDGE
jgi:hypothetical protein